MEKLKLYATYGKDTLHANFAIGKDDSSYCSAFVDELTKMLDYGKKKKKDIVPVLRRIQSQKIVRLASIDIETGVVSPDYAVLVDLKDFTYGHVKVNPVKVDISEALQVDKIKEALKNG